MGRLFLIMGTLAGLLVAYGLAFPPKPHPDRKLCALALASGDGEEYKPLLCETDGHVLRDRMKL